MGRPSLRAQRRTEIINAFAAVLAEQGYEGATIAAVAERAGVAPGLVHHYFTDKEEIVEAVLTTLVERFRTRVRAKEAGEDPLTAYVNGAVALDASADLVAARCWVGVFAEALRSPALFGQVRRLVDGEIDAIQRRSGGALSTRDSGGVLALVVGALVLGAFAPRKTAGFAAPALAELVRSLRSQ